MKYASYTEINRSNTIYLIKISNDELWYTLIGYICYGNFTAADYPNAKYYFGEDYCYSIEQVKMHTLDDFLYLYGHYLV